MQLWMEFLQTRTRIFLTQTYVPFEGYVYPAVMLAFSSLDVSQRHDTKAAVIGDFQLLSVYACGMCM